MTEVLMTVGLFTGVLMLLVGIIVAVRIVLVGRGVVTIVVSGHSTFSAPIGLKLHQVLVNHGIPVAAACGGRGTCGLCRVRVSGMVDAPLPTETALLDPHAVARGARLSCQVTLRGDIEVEMEEGLPSSQVLETRVRSIKNLTPLMKEIVLELPKDAPFEFRAGSFVQVNCPPYRMSLADLPVDVAFADDWKGLDVAHLEASCERPTTRAYSLANHPHETGIAMLVVRLALPPPGVARDVPPGIVSSYLFALRPGDPVMLTGPFGHFTATDSDKEMIFVGGGAGMAPMRAHIFEQLEVLHATRKISFWYGARGLRDLFYREEFDQLQERYPNFSWSVALSAPLPDDRWEGATGFIHAHLREAYLAAHPAPADCEYYLCGPPLMVRAVVAMLEQLGVERSAIFFDDFGG